MIKANSVDQSSVHETQDTPTHTQGVVEYLHVQVVMSFIDKLAKSEWIIHDGLGCPRGSHAVKILYHLKSNEKLGECNINVIYLRLSLWCELSLDLGQNDQYTLSDCS